MGSKATGGKGERGERGKGGKGRDMPLTLSPAFANDYATNDRRQRSKVKVISYRNVSAVKRYKMATDRS